MQFRVIVILLVAQFTIAKLLGQEILIQNIKSTDKIGSYRISNIRNYIADSYGFIWIATQDGLFRYDSRNITYYNTSENKNHRLNGSDIRSLSIDLQNKLLWCAATSGGVNAIDLVTGNVMKSLSPANTPFVKENTISKLVQDGNILYFCTSKGVWSYDNKKGTAKILNGTENTSFENMILHRGILILLNGSKGIFTYDPAAGRIMDSVIFKNRNRIFDVAKFNDGEWYFSSTSGLKKLKILGNNKMEYSENPLSKFTGSGNFLVYGVCVDKEKNIWFSTENDLRQINTAQNKLFIIKANNPNPETDVTKTVFNVFCDDNNRIWLGGIDGFSFIKNSNLPFQAISHSVASSEKIGHAYFISPQSDSMVFVCAEDGLYKSDFKNGIISTIDNTESYDYFFTDFNKRQIISNSSGLYCLQNKQKTPIEQLYPEFKKVIPLRINSHIFLNDSCIVMGTENHKGIVVWNFIAKRVEQFNASSVSGKLAEDVINNVCLLSNGKILILGEQYISLFDYYTKRLQNISELKFTQKNYSLFFDFCKIRNNYYFATYGHGVVVTDENFNYIKEISTVTGLSNNGVYKLLPWKDSLLFITTNNGLNVYNVATTAIKQYYQTDGLHGDAFEETSGSLSTGSLFAGGAKGYSVIYPANIRANNTPPVLYCFRISMETSSGMQIDTSNLEAIRFPVSNDVIQTIVYFSGINYSNSERTLFAYRILEQSTEWINLGSQNFVSFISQPPGTYHLQVKAANEDGVWSEPKELVLVFLPKWYQTWWFYLLIALTAAGILYALYRYRISQIKKQHAIRKNIATDLHDDLGSTLNSVKVFTNLAISGVKQEESLQQVKDNLTEATMSLRDMIWVLDDSLDTVDELVTRLKQFALPITAASNMEFSITAGNDVNSRTLTKEEKRNLFLICKEIINNSIKYSGASKITVDILPAGKKIQITVGDNGKGFDAATVKKGYGLKNMQYRAGQVKYKVILYSSIANGTNVQINPL